MEVIRLQRIDESILPEHSCLETTDYCYFLGEYASGRGFNHSEMNQIINNLKKPINRKHLPEWHFKEQAIQKIAFWLMSTNSWEKLKSCTWVPMPPSKIKSHSEYDDCILRILKRAKQFELKLDVRELLLAKTSRDPAHNPGNKRPSIADHFNNLMIDEGLKDPPPRAIVIFDDVITSGASFKAAQKILLKNFPEVPIVGIFVARNIKIIDALI